MKNKKIIIFVLLISMFTLTACFGKSDEENKNKAAVEFKNDYEKNNGKENSSGKVHRAVTISDKNVFEEVTPEEVVKKIENKETFYVYFGSTLCPWCRSVIEMADQVSRDNEIEKIYYVDIWNDEGAEIFRDKYTLGEDNNDLVVEFEGTEAYKTLINVFADLLEDYTLTDSNGNKVEVGEKRIYAPNYVYIENGAPKRLVTGISDKQSGSRDELTEEILNDEEKIFNSFFVNACDDKC